MVATINMAVFCLPMEEANESSAPLCKPWVKGGYEYATDGKIIARRRTDQPDNFTDHHSTRINIAAWFEFSEMGEPTSEVEAPSPTPCPECAGVGKVNFVPCAACIGTGDLECSCGHQHECEECNGEGKIKSPLGKLSECPDCDGLGSFWNHAGTKLAGMVIQDKYLALIVGHGAEIRAATSRGLRGDRVFYFKAGEVDGLLMPMKSGDYKEAAFLDKKAKP